MSSYNIKYLDSGDVDQSGRLIHPDVASGIALVMIMSGGCGHCTAAKPAFHNYADKFGGDNTKSNISVLYVEADGGGASLLQSVGKVWDVQYFPTYKVFNDGNAVSTTQPKDRSTIGLYNFVSDHAVDKII
jgi:thiol-disulfide isomerase/thioredoxin